MRAVAHLIRRGRLLWVTYLVAAVIVSLQQWWLSQPEDRFTHYNNYQIFIHAFHHLKAQQDLYVLYLDQHWDFYKYSPTFAVLMAPFAALPALPGLIIWNLLNASVLLLGIRSLPLPQARWIFFGWYVLIEAITSMQNTQTNALIAGLLLLAFSTNERAKPWATTLFITLTLYIKLFGAAAYLLVLFSTRRLTFVVAAVCWFAVFFTIPLLIVPFDYLFKQYGSWLQLLQQDYAGSQGISIAGILYRWWGWLPDKIGILLIGTALLSLPLLIRDHYADVAGRAAMFSAWMLWMILFNHKAESATYIIAVSGATLWLLMQPWNFLNRSLAVILFAFTILASTDWIPRIVRQQFFEPYVIKAIPCLIIWLWIVALLYRKLFMNWRRSLRQLQNTPPG